MSKSVKGLNGEEIVCRIVRTAFSGIGAKLNVEGSGQGEREKQHTAKRMLPLSSPTGNPIGSRTNKQTMLEKTLSRSKRL